jgi:hypothetical protein
MSCRRHQADYAGEKKTSNEQTDDQYLAYSHYTIFIGRYMLLGIRLVSLT